MSDQNNKLAVTAKDLEGRMRFVEESLAELGTTTEDLKGRLRPVEQSLQPVPSLMGRLTNDQERLLDRIRTVEADRTSLRRDLMSLTETVDRLSHETDTFVRWTRELGADAKRRSALPKGPNPELQLREALEPIARGNAR